MNSLLKRILASASAALAFMPAALASDTAVDGIYYDFDAATSSATVTYKGKCQCAGDTYAGDVVIPSSVVYEGKTYTVNAIGVSAFSSSRDLVSVSIPSSVELIDMNAFVACYKLESVNIARPSRLRTIGRHAFLACKNLKSIDIPASVESIGKYCFQLCESLANVTFEEPSSLTVIEDYVFCRTGITNYYLPKSVTTISAVAFCQNPNMTEINLSASISSISQQNPFAYNTQVTRITVDPANKVYDSRNDCNAIIETKTNTLVAGSKASVIPASVTAIGRSAFNHVTDLTDAALPATIRTIGKYAYLGCNGLRSFFFPSTMISMADSVFQRVESLDSVVVMTQRPFAIDESDFMPSVYETATLYVPAGTAPLYRAASVWSNFRNIVEMDRFVVGGISYELTADGTAQVTEPQENVPYEGTLSIPARVTSGTKTYEVSGATEDALKPQSGKSLRVVWSSNADAPSNVTVYGTHGHIKIEGAQGEAQVYNAAGVIMVSTTRRSIPIEQGVYVVTVDGTTTKVIVD